MQGCRSLQLRAATSLGRLWHAQGRSAEAVQLLQSACAQLTEGHDWDDFKAASQLLRIAATASAPADDSADSDAAPDSYDEPPVAEMDERA
jgi:predicted ATPase